MFQYTHQKHEGKDFQLRYRNFAVMSGIRNLFTSKWMQQSLLPLIKEDVVAVSIFMRRFTLYIYHLFREKCVNDDVAAVRAAREYFGSLTQNSFTKLHVSFKNHENTKFFDEIEGHETEIQLRGSSEFSFKRIILKNAVAEFATNVGTNIMTHLYNRAHRMAKLVKKEGMTDKETHDAIEVWVAQKLIENKPYSLIFEMIRWQISIAEFNESVIENEKEGEQNLQIKTFSLVPIFKAGNMHILYDNEALKELLNRYVKLRNAKRSERHRIQVEGIKKRNQGLRKNEKEKLPPKPKSIRSFLDLKDNTQVRQRFFKIFRFWKFERPRYKRKIVIL